MITIGELITHKQPDTALEIQVRYGKAEIDFKGFIVSKFIEWIYDGIERLIQEPPRPGRAGLLPGEKEVG